MIKHVIVRKIVRLGKVAKMFRAMSIVALIYGLFGLLLYITVFPSSLIMIDSVLWIIDSATYLALFMVLSVVSSKALNSSKYELLRIEDVLSLILALLSLSITTYLILNTVFVEAEVTPDIMSLYLVGSGLLSYLFSIYLSRINKGKIRNVIANTVAKRTLLDTLIEFVSASSIVISNITGLMIIEELMFLALSAYAIRYSLHIAKEAILNILNVNEPKHIRYKVIKTTRRYDNLFVRRVVIRRLGSFAEVELWVELPNSLSLIATHSIVLKLARDVVSNVPEVIRALVIALPDVKKVVNVETPLLNARLAIHGERIMKSN